MISPYGKIGDRVLIVAEDSQFFGMVGRIDSLYGLSTDLPYNVIISRYPGGAIPFGDHEFLVVERGDIAVDKQSMIEFMLNHRWIDETEFQSLAETADSAVLYRLVELSDERVEI